MCGRRLLRVPWTARKSNQSILKEISPWISLEGMMLKLKLQYFDHLMQIVDKKLWCWEGLGAGGEGDDRGWDGWMASLTRWTRVQVNSGSWWWTGRPGVLRFMGSQRVRHDWAWYILFQIIFPYRLLQDTEYISLFYTVSPCFLPIFHFACGLTIWICFEISSVQFSRSVVSDSLWPHESQHVRPPCPLPTPWVHSNSRP